MVNLIVKNVVDRTRPYEVVEGLRCLVERQMDASFPSGHASASFASSVALLMYLPWKKAAAGLVILAGIIAFSRLYVGVHYPTDVQAGFVVALVGSSLAVWGVRTKLGNQ